MSRILKHIETLVYYDGPQLIVAHDQLQVRYLCILVKREDPVDKFLCVPLSLGRLNDFLWSKLDLRTIVNTSETGELYLGTTSDDQCASIEASSLAHEEIPPEWLPLPGFLFAREPSHDGKIINEATERSRAVLHFALNPPESRNDTKITAEHLGQSVKLIQRLIKQSFRKAMLKLDSSMRPYVDLPENYELEVFSFSPGSFTVHMQTTAFADMFGYSQIAKALDILDFVNQELDNPEATVDAVSQYGGHFAIAYRDLIKFIIDNDTAMQYEWTMPELRHSHVRRISVPQAQPIYDILVRREDIGKEERLLIGTVLRADVRYGTWRIHNEDDQREYSGRTAPDSDVRLAGITIETRRYKFVCEEHLEEERGTGRETTVLYLNSYKELP